MTIKRRILVGHLAVASLMLLPAAYAVRSLWTVTEATRTMVQQGLSRLEELDKLRSNFGMATDLLKMNTAFQDDRRFAINLDQYQTIVQQTYQQARPDIVELGMERELAHLDRMLLLANPAPDEPYGPSAEAAWTRGEIARAKSELNDAYYRALDRMRRDTRAAEIRAYRAWAFSLACLCVAGLLAVVSTVLAVRGMRRPMERLMSATMAVSAGRFGIAVPAGGGDDDLSRLTEAFNKMSQNLALFETMKADFLSIAAHELRTPLTCIKGYAGALRTALPAEAAASEKVARYLDRIDKEADLMTAQVSELLTLGMIEAGQLRLELREIPSEGFLIMVAEAFRPIAAERGIDFRTELEGVPRSFIGDRSRLNQVVLNLLDNALKFTPAGGRVFLRGTGRGERLEIEVSDTCGGIPPDQLGVIFEKYARVRSGAGKEKPGTGLGLAVARGIVTAHGGTIEAASEVGQGCRFTVRLPVRHEAGAARAPGKEVA